MNNYTFIFAPGPSGLCKWVITLDGHSCSLQDSPGLRYIHRLLGSPRLPISPAELGGLADASCDSSELYDALAKTADLSGVGEDEHTGYGTHGPQELTTRSAVRQVRQHVKRLHREAECTTDITDREKLTHEANRIEEFLKKDTGLHGAVRVFRTEHTRVGEAVSKAIVAALKSLRQADPAIGKYFDRTILSPARCRKKFSAGVELNKDKDSYLVKENGWVYTDESANWQLFFDFFAENDEPPDAGSPECIAPVTMVRDGASWLIRYEEEQCEVKDLIGLQHLSVLLKFPGRKIASLRLREGVDLEDHNPTLSLPEMEDAESESACGDLQQLAELLQHTNPTERDKRQNAQQGYYDEHSVEGVEWKEIVAVLDAKLRALAAEAANARNRGLHDKFNELGLKYHKLKDGLDKYEQRCKSTAQLSERNDKARPAVSLAIGAAIKARGTQNPKLGQYFESTIVTGAECEYTGCESASAPL